MPRGTIPLNELTTYLFGTAQSALAAEVGSWLVASPQFRSFAETYRDKIRKKVYGQRDDEGRRDLAFELGVALRVLAEGRFALEYEPYGVGERAPDFRVTFRSRLLFNIEVRRLRQLVPTAAASAAESRLVRATSAKPGQ